MTVMRDVGCRCTHASREQDQRAAPSRRVTPSTTRNGRAHGAHRGLAGRRLMGRGAGPLAEGDAMAATPRHLATAPRSERRQAPTSSARTTVMQHACHLHHLLWGAPGHRGGGDTQNGTATHIAQPCTCLSWPDYWFGSRPHPGRPVQRAKQPMWRRGCLQAAGACTNGWSGVTQWSGTASWQGRGHGRDGR
jgi:hypothetical protein